MIRGLYTAGSGMISQAYRQDVITNNLANSNTTGYKRDAATIRAFPAMLLLRLNDGSPVNIGYLGTGAVLDGTYTDFSPGSLKETGNPFDLAIAGPGFFTVALEDRLAYTRNGVFSLDGNGYLVDAEGHRVQGNQGDIRLDPGGEVVITEEGVILQNGEEVSRLEILVPGEGNRMEKLAGNLYVPLDPDLMQVADSRVLSGYVETSNVKAVREMMDLLASFRTYEACQKAIQAADETLGKAVNEVGRTY